jgi:hypothetical protein
VVNSGSDSGIPRLRRKIPLLIEKESSKTVCPGSLNQKDAGVNQDGKAEV